MFRLWSAVEVGLRGDYAAMARNLDAIDAEKLTEHNQFVHALVAALNYSAALTPQEQRRDLKTLRRHIREGLKILPNYRTNATLARTHHRIMSHLTRRLAPFPLNYIYYWRLL